MAPWGAPIAHRLSHSRIVIRALAREGKGVNVCSPRVPDLFGFSDGGSRSSTRHSLVFCGGPEPATCPPLSSEPRFLSPLPHNNAAKLRWALGLTDASLQICWAWPKSEV